jgi:Uma2 family endonuclease
MVLMQKYEHLLNEGYEEILDSISQAIYFAFLIKLRGQGFKVITNEPDVIFPGGFSAKPHIAIIEQDVLRTEILTVPPVLVVEILPPGLIDFEEIPVAEMYFEGGVHEYWCINLGSTSIKVFATIEERIVLYDSWEFGSLFKDSISSLYFKGMTMNAAELFEEAFAIA